LIGGIGIGLGLGLASSVLAGISGVGGELLEEEAAVVLVLAGGCVEEEAKRALRAVLSARYFL
jgi:hypothetical protein